MFSALIPKRGRLAVAVPLIGFAVFCACLLALPGQTVVTKYVSELFIPLDGAYRVLVGEVPNRDFHSALGPLAYYIPALGNLLSGRLGAAMPAGMAALTVLLAPVIAYVLASRLRPIIAIPFGLFVILVLVVPLNLGESVTALSPAKFYNNIGWAALASLFVMYLPRRPGHPDQDRWDLACAAALTLMMVYTKLTYGLVALAFLLALLINRRHRRWAGGALALCAVTGLVAEWFWRGSLAYLSDIRMAAEVSGLVRGTAGQIVDHVLGNLADYVLLVLFAGTSLWRTRSLRDFGFYLACAVVGFLLINQNFQAWGILTIHAAAAVAAETYLRCTDLDSCDERPSFAVIRAGLPLLFIALVLPTIVHCSIGLGLHAVVALSRSGQEVKLPNVSGLRLVNLWTWGDFDIGSKFVAATEEGAAALAELDPKPARVMVLDVSNPFTAGLGLIPPLGDTPWLQWGRTIDAMTFFPPEQLFSDVQIVMEPKPATDAESEPAQVSGKALRELYRPYIAEHFETMRETEHWTLHRRKTAGPSLSCNAPCPGSAAIAAALSPGRPR